MKVRFIISLLAILFMAVGVIHAEVNTVKRVVFEGEIGRETSRSGAPIPPPIEATISDDCIINVVFTEPIGEVTVLVDGEVDQTCEVTTVGQETALSVAGLEPGTYKLEFETPAGGYVCGEFVIE